MAVRFRAGVDGPDLVATSISMTVPSTTQVGDLIVVSFYTRGTFTITTGYTEILAVGVPMVNSTVNNQGLYFYAKRAVTGDPGSTVTITQTASARMGGGIVVIYDDTGKEVKEVLQATQADNSSVNPGQHTIPALTVQEGDLLIGASTCVYAHGTEVRNYTPSLGWTSLIATPGVAIRIGIAYREVGAGGGGSITGTFQHDTAPHDSVAGHVVFRPFTASTGLSVTPPPIAPQVALGTPLWTLYASVAPGNILTAEALGIFAIGGLVQVTAGNILTGESVPSPQALAISRMVTGNIAPTAVTGTGILDLTAQSVFPGAISSTISLGVPNAVSHSMVIPTQIASTVAVSIPVLGQNYMMVGAIDSTVAVGIQNVSSPGAFFNLVGISGQESVSAIRADLTPITALVAGLGSTAAVGNLVTQLSTAILAPGGVPYGGATSSPGVFLGELPLMLNVPSIAPQATVGGAPILGLTSVKVSPSGITSQVALGTLTVGKKNVHPLLVIGHDYIRHD